MLTGNQQPGRRMDRTSRDLAPKGLGLCALAAAALMPAQALAGDYWFLGAGTNVYDFVDVTQITAVDDGARQAWTTRVLEGKGSTGKKVKLVLSLAIFYCGQDAMRLVTQVQYRGNGALKSNQDFPRAKLERIIPGTLGAVEGHDLAVDAGFAHAARDELGDLRAEIENEDGLFHGALVGQHALAFQPFFAGPPGASPASASPPRSPGSADYR